MNLNQFVAYRITSILNVLRITSCKYPKMSRDKPKNRTDRCAGHILQNAKFSLTSSPKIGNSRVSRMGGFGSLGRKDWSGEVVKVLRGTPCMSYVFRQAESTHPIQYATGMRVHRRNYMALHYGPDPASCRAVEHSFCASIC